MTANPRFDPARRRAVTFSLLLVTSLAAFEATVVTTAMPTIIGDLEGVHLYSWVFAVYLLTSTVSMPFYGRMADLHGRRRVILAAIAVFAAGALACAFARTMPALVAARALQGLGAGGLVPLALTVAGDLYTVDERARIQGLFSSVWGIAGLVGPLGGAALTVTLGWRSIFAVNLPLALLAVVLVRANMVESRPPAAAPLDWPGLSTLAASVSLLLLGVLRHAGEDPLGPGLRALLLVAGLAGVALFVRIEGRSPHPLVPLGLFRDPATATPYLSAVLLGTTIFGVETFVPLFVQGARGGSAGSAGAAITPLVLFWSLSAMAGARSVVTRGFRFTAIAGGIAIVAGLAGLLAATLLHAPIAAISVACALVGAGLGPTSITQVLSIQSAAAEKQRGVATSLVPFFRMAGGSLGVGILGGLFSAALASAPTHLHEGAGRFLAAGRGVAAPTPLEALEFRQALEGALLPVFAILAVIAVLNLGVATRFLERQAEAAPESPVPPG